MHECASFIVLASSCLLSSNQVIKFLPLMIGWFSLSVPSALGLYWILNNFISTATSVFIRNKVRTRSLRCTFAGGVIGDPWLAVNVDSHKC